MGVVSYTTYCKSKSRIISFCYDVHLIVSLYYSKKALANLLPACIDHIWYRLCWQKEKAEKLKFQTDLLKSQGSVQSDLSNLILLCLCANGRWSWIAVLLCNAQRKKTSQYRERHQTQRATKRSRKDDSNISIYQGNSDPSHTRSFPPTDSLVPSSIVFTMPPTLSSTVWKAFSSPNTLAPALPISVWTNLQAR